MCARYGELEAKTLAERVPRVEVTRADDVELAAAEMAATTARAAETLAEPLDRCVALTAGTEAAAMLGAVDDALAKYATSLLAAMRRVRRARGMPVDGDGEDGGFTTAEVSGTSPAGEESIQAALRLVSVAAALTSACETLERGFVRALRELRDALDPALPRAARPDDVNPAPLPEPASVEALTPALAAVHADQTARGDSERSSTARRVTPGSGRFPPGRLGSPRFRTPLAPSCSTRSCRRFAASSRGCRVDGSGTKKPPTRNFNSRRSARTRRST